jgi:hypothetical protein
LICIFSVCRTWQERRVLYSKDIVYFAPVEGDTVIDMIPIVEILAVSEENEEDESMKYASGESRVEKHNSFPDQASFLRKKTPLDKKEGVPKTANTLSIATHPEGYNSGRKYYLQAESSDIRTQVIRELTHLSKAARKAAERKSKFQRSQAKVKRIFLSYPFHVLMSITILVV